MSAPRQLSMALQLLTCRRCGFDWERPMVQGMRPSTCRECRPIVQREKQAEWNRARRPRRVRLPAGGRGKHEAWRSSLAYCGLPTERTVAEWLAHPSALTELYCVVFGLLRLTELSGYRAREVARLRERLADLTDFEQRRIARSDAIRARLHDLAA